MPSITEAIEKRESAPAQVTPRENVRMLIERNSDAIHMSLPRGFEVERFKRLLLTAANTNPDLFTCEPTSFLAAGVAAAQLGLEPNDARGLAYLIPFKDKRRGKIVTLILGYRGMMDLARRSGMVSSINAFPVYEEDEFSYALGLEPTLHHVPGDHDEDPAKLTHVYAVAKINGDPQFVVLTRKQIDKARNSSAGGRSDYSPWVTHYVEMGLKTAIRRLCKFLPQTVEMAQAMSNEDRPLSFGDFGSIAADNEDAIDIELSDGINHVTGELVDPAVA